MESCRRRAKLCAIARRHQSRAPTQRNNHLDAACQAVNDRPEPPNAEGRPPGTGRPASHEITKAVSNALDGFADAFTCAHLYIAPDDAEPQTIDAQLAGIENVFQEPSDWYDCDVTNLTSMTYLLQGHDTFATP